MKAFVMCLFVLASCGLPSHQPVTGIYDLTTNDITSDSPAGCAKGMAAPMTLELLKEGNIYDLYICGQLNASCSQKQLYATSADGYNFTIVALFSGSFNISYYTTNGRTTISGTGLTAVTFLGASCQWNTVFDGVRR